MTVIHPYYRPRMGDAFGRSFDDAMHAEIVPSLDVRSLGKVAIIGVLGAFLLGGFVRALGGKKRDW